MVDHRPVRRQAVYPRPGITNLRERRDRTGLQETKAQAGKPGQRAAVLVKAGCQPYRIGKIHPKDMHRVM